MYESGLKKLLAEIEISIDANEELCAISMIMKWEILIKIL